jgi:hypothetical protein
MLPVKQYGSKKISEFTLSQPKLSDEVLAVLTKVCCADFGFKQPEGGSTLRIIEGIQQHFGDLEIKEIYKAFEIASLGKLEVNMQNYGKPLTKPFLYDLLNKYIALKIAHLKSKYDEDRYNRLVEREMKKVTDGFKNSKLPNKKNILEKKPNFKVPKKKPFSVLKAENDKKIEILKRKTD